MADTAYDPVAARFDTLRKRLQEQKSQTQSEQDEALKRRFAQQGMLNSGAYLKAQEEQGNNLEKQTQQGMQDIGFQEDQERQRLQEVQDARKYQTSEREASQQFTQGMFDKDLALKQQAQNLANAELQENIKTNRLNATVAFKNAGISQDDFDRITGQLGEFYDMFSFNKDGSIGPALTGGSSGGSVTTQPALSGGAPSGGASGSGGFNPTNSTAYNNRKQSEATSAAQLADRQKMADSILTFQRPVNANIFYNFKDQINSAVQNITDPGQLKYALQDIKRKIAAAAGIPI